MGEIKVQGTDGVKTEGVMSMIMAFFFSFFLFWTCIEIPQLPSKKKHWDGLGTPKDGEGKDLELRLEREQYPGRGKGNETGL